MISMYAPLRGKGVLKDGPGGVADMLEKGFHGAG